MKPATKIEKFEVCIFGTCPHCGKDFSVEYRSSSVSAEPTPGTQARTSEAGAGSVAPASESVEELKKQIEEVIERDESGKALSVLDRYKSDPKEKDENDLRKILEEVLAAEQEGIEAEKRRTAEAEEKTQEQEEEKEWEDF